ncbi:N-formylglutamate amidohydrolase [Noviherbaspirillum autotrophicum]|uniref:N-formylglutamate amidohydrolase n=1 Tax=Noviherbaspirillum autotrophicum TaxID=709839 RepID=A0A0C2BTK9_9BURK|nr:N-formylglutamate amidohydrolase [Noviherbaspirillum autotrophicum]KIF81361.1 N-formylglutamate amidohydrolase [Noviherbaspirillum autotrophicum]
MRHPDHFIITCEHAGNRIPSRYRDFFRDRQALLHTHRGYDLGALRVAREMSARLDAPLLVSTISRLLVDLNRSLGHPEAFSEVTRGLSGELRDEIATRYYLPYRRKAETMIAQAIDAGARVVHVSCHSFTPELNGAVRDADIGLLYDPDRSAEAELCRRWRVALHAYAAALKARMNYPYAGTADGFTVYLRQRFGAERYLGIELEINQKHVRASGAAHWRTVRHAIIEALRSAAPQVQPA